MSEFDLIQRYFNRATPSAELGVGDDAALLRVGSGMEVAISTDMLVSGTHFLPDTDPFMLGHKTLAVNLSDLAAMGAQPRWALLSLSLPHADDKWLQKFSEGFFALADQYGVELVGGDTTRGSLNLCVTIIGEIPPGVALRRSGAQIGDDIWVSGYLGDAALALAHLQGKVQMSAADFSLCASALHQPVPRVGLGLALRGVANSAIDVSDGLLADLGHILECSKLGAEIEFNALPVSSAMRPYLSQTMGMHCALAGGDDYELCFTVPVARRDAVENLSRRMGLPLTRIGTIVAGNGCVVRAADGSVINIEESGYDHFR
ncbi:MAG: thiamine-phosphate kinase [Nitrosomonadales bacterium]